MQCINQCPLHWKCRGWTVWRCLKKPEIKLPCVYAWGHACVHVGMCGAYVLSCFSHVQLCATPRTVAHRGSSVQGIFQTRILEWVAMPSSRGSSQPRDQTWVSHVSCDGRWVLYPWHHLGSPKTTIWPRNPTPGALPWESHNSKRYMRPQCSLQDYLQEPRHGRYHRTY